MNAAAEEIWAILREVAQSQKETDLKFKEYVAENEIRSRETDERMRETAERMRETDKKVKEMTASIGRLGNKLGDFVEEMVRPAAVRLFREQGIDVHEVHRGVSSKRNGEGIEVDLLVVNDNDVVAIECKSTLSIDDVNEHVIRLEKLKRLLPTYKDKRAMGAVTGMVIPDNVAAYAYKQGFYVIAQSGEHLLIRNGEDFRPRVW